jgi:hypothetical protein
MPHFVLLLLLALLLPAPALAWPVDLAVELRPGSERFHKLSVVDWVEVEDPQVATAELLPGTNELLLTGQRAGSTRLLLYAEGTFAVWRLDVRTPGERTEAGTSTAPLAAARGACPGLQAGQGSEPFLRAAVNGAACRQALLALLRTDAFVARDLELTLDVAVLQAQLAQLTPGLAALGLSASYRGAGLVLAGTTSPAGHRRALWQLFEHSLGRVPLEDRVKVEVAEPQPEKVEAPDAGAPPTMVVRPPGTRDPAAPRRRKRATPPSG